MSDTSKPITCLLNDLFKAIESGSKKELNQIIRNLQPLLDSVDTNVVEAFKSEENPLKDTNVVILGCKFGKIHILNHILSNCQQFIKSLYNDTIDKRISLSDEDGEGHSAFYYAIRSNNIELVQLLLTKWWDYIDESVACKDILLSKAYEHLKLRNVTLTDEMEFFVEKEIVASRLIFGRESNMNDDVLERIDWLRTTIDTLRTEVVESKFLVMAKCIALNMNILKQQLKATYDMLPWEELEFCVITYISSRLPHDEKTIVKFLTITKETLLSQLGCFASILENINSQHLTEPNEFPNMSRETLVSKIKNNSPEFITLYEIFEKVRDFYSLDKIGEYLTFSLAVDHKEKQGQLAILRVLQVLSDSLKNTSENCQLSNVTSRVVLSALPMSTRNTVINLRNTVSQAHSLKKILEIEEKPPEFFLGIQNDLKLLSHVVSRILNNKKLRIFVDLLEKITQSDNGAEVAGLAKDIVQFRNCIAFENVELLEEKKIQKLIGELRKSIPNSLLSESLFDDVSTSLSYDARELGIQSLRADFVTLLQCIDFFKEFDRELDAPDLALIKSAAATALHSLSPTKYIQKRSTVLKFAKDIEEIFKRKSSYFKYLKVDMEKISMLLFEISFAAATQLEDVLCVHAMDNVRDSIEIVDVTMSESVRKTLIDSKITVLKNIVGCEGIENNANFFKENKKLRLAVELLLLEILTISNETKCKSEINTLHVDSYTPLLTGKCFKNYLAHGHALFDIFPNDPATAIQSYAYAFIMCRISIKDKEIEKVFCYGVPEGKEKLNENMKLVTNQDQLFHALQAGDIERAIALIKLGADFFGRSNSQESSLHYAARNPILDTIKFIVEQKVEVNLQDKEGRTALHVAAAHGNIAVVEYLILNAPNVNIEQKDNNGQAPLHLAAKCGEVETVALLVKFGADILARDKNLRTPLFRAVEENKLNVVKTLLEHGADLNGGAFHVAARRNHVAIMKLMIKKGVDVDFPSDRGSIPLILAARYGCVEAVKILINAGANINAYRFDSTALYFAAENGHTAVVDVLLQSGADPDTVKSVNKPIHIVAETGNLEIVELLIQHKADLTCKNSKGLFPLHLAAQHGHVNIIQALLKAGVDVRSVNNKGATALHCSVATGHVEATKLLIEKGVPLDVTECPVLHIAAAGGYEEVGKILITSGAAINARNMDDHTPLHLAIGKKANLLVKLLLESGAEPDVRDSTGATPVHIGTTAGNVDGVTDLIAYKCDVNQTDGKGMALLHIAAAAGCYELAEMFLKSGADVNCMSQGRYTPLIFATKGGHLNLVELLVKSGANVNLGEPRPILQAIENNSKDVLEYLVKQGSDLSKVDLLFKAVCSGMADCVRVLLDNGYPANSSISGERSALHMAAEMGYKEIVCELLHHGANVNSTASDRSTPLHYSVKSGNCEVVEILLSNGANINSKTSFGHTALYVAADSGDPQIIELLIAKGADPLEEVGNKETPLSKSIRSGDVKKVEAMYKSKRLNKDARFSNKTTPLHLSASYSLDIVKFLMKNDYVPNLVDDDKQPIHMASFVGQQNIVEYFLDSGVSVNITCCEGQTPLHYAALKGKLPLVTYLVSKGANINAEDNVLRTPLILAQNNGNIVRFLFENGAYFNEDTLVNDADQTYLNVISLLKAVKGNDVRNVEKYLVMGTCPNAISSCSGSPLHFASCKGYFDIVKLLLEHKANPNVVATEAYTPLHKAAEFSQENIVLELLTHGAIYNSLTDTETTPLNLATDGNIRELLSVIETCFDQVEKRDVNVESTIGKIQNRRHLEALIKTRNRNNESIFEVAERCKYPKLNELYEICQEDFKKHQEMNEKTVSTLKSEFEKQRELFGDNNDISNILLELEKYDDAMNLAEDVYNKRRNLFGPHHRLSLQTQRLIGLLHHRQGNNEKSWEILDQVWRTQLQANEDQEACITRFYTSFVLKDLGKLGDAYHVILEVYEELLEADFMFSIGDQKKLAETLSQYDHLKEARTVYEDIYNNTIQMYGPDHVDSLSALQHIGMLNLKLMDFAAGFKTFRTLAESQKTYLGAHHPDYIKTKNIIDQEILAFSASQKDTRRFQEVFDSNVIAYAMRGDLKNLRFLLEEGYNVNESDNNGNTALQYAVDRVDEKCVNLLLQYDADVAHASHKGNTALHTAVNKQSMPIVKMLLEFASKKIDFINAPTSERGTTAIHVAAKNGNLDIVKMLLKYGAIYEIKNRDGATPKDLSSNVEVVQFLNVLSVMFSAAKTGKFRLIKQLKSMTKEDVTAAVNAKNIDGRTIHQVVSKYKHKNISRNLVKIIQSIDV